MTGDEVSLEGPSVIVFLGTDNRGDWISNLDVFSVGTSQLKADAGSKTLQDGAATFQKSRPWIIACFTIWPDSYEELLTNAILLGGDTDTIAALAGAISGVFRGVSAIPKHFLDALEDGHKGKRYIEQLAERLSAICVLRSRLWLVGNLTPGRTDAKRRGASSQNQSGLDIARNQPMSKASVQHARLNCSRHLRFCFRFGVFSGPVEAAAGVKFFEQARDRRARTLN